MGILTKLRQFLRKKPIKIGLALIAFLILVAFSHIAYLCYYIFLNRSNMPDIEPLVRFEPPAIGTIYDRNGQVIMNLAHEFRWIVKPEEIPPVIKQGFLSAEDKYFYGHKGISWMDIGRATYINMGYIFERLLGGKGVDVTPQQGASTIDQQLVRLSFLSDKTKIENSDNLVYDNYFTWLASFIIDKPNINRAWRKVEEARLALWINEQFSNANHFGSPQKAKDEILARYLSYVYFRYVYGIKAAARMYFNKELSEFTFDDADQAAFLAGVIKNPLAYAPSLNQSPDISSTIILRQINRRNAVLDQMVENNFITRERVVRFKERDIPIPTKDIRTQTNAPSVVGDVFKEIRTYGLTSDKVFNGDIQVYTTVNAKIQKIAQDACENGLLAYEERHPEGKNEIQCSIVVLRNIDGAILAEIGGRKEYKGQAYKYSDLNRVNRLRPVGSSFKPFVYLTAYLNGWLPTDAIVDSPFSISLGYNRGRHSIQNYDRKYIGTASIEEMLYRSRNVPTVKLALLLGDGQKSGMEKVADTIKLLGIKSELHNDIDHRNKRIYYLTSALGASEMSLMELTNAYRAMASGISAEPHIVENITDRKGEGLILKNYGIPRLEIHEYYLSMIRSSLRKVVTKPGGTAYSLTLQKFPVPVAGKTGTVDDFRNALFIGFTHGEEGVTVGAAVNYDDNRELGSAETGSRTALPIFKEIMEKIYEQNLVGPPPEYPD